MKLLAQTMRRSWQGRHTRLRLAELDNHQLCDAGPKRLNGDKLADIGLTRARALVEYHRLLWID